MNLRIPGGDQVQIASVIASDMFWRQLSGPHLHLWCVPSLGSSFQNISGLSCRLESLTSSKISHPLQLTCNLRV